MTDQPRADVPPPDWPHAALASASARGDVRKAHGTGNDFVVVVDFDDRVALDERVVAALCDRHFGIGGDGVIRIVATGAPDAPIHMDYRNADGAIVEMCGNGVRVVAAIVAAERPALVDGGRLVIDTRAGLRPVSIAGAGGDVEVTVDMGPATLTTEAIHLDPAHADGEAGAFVLVSPRVASFGPRREGASDDGPPASFAAVSMGNPHAITVVEDVDDVALEALGPTVGQHPAFREGVNVNVAAHTGDQQVALRVFERGVGETLACGTGACATVAALDAAGTVDATSTVTVAVRGGHLAIRRDERGHMLMTGPARVVGAVHLDESWLQAVATTP